MFVAPVVDDGCRFGHHLRWWASDSSKIRVVAQLKLFLCYFIDLYKTPSNCPRPTPSDGGPSIGLGQFIELMLNGGQTEHHGDDVC
jgi:hypothetical protein